MKKAVPVLILAILIAAGVLVYLKYLRVQAPADLLVVSGNIEVTDAQLSFKIAGRLINRLVDEGHDITTGQLLARLDPTDQDQAVTKAEAKLRQSEAALAELVNGTRPQEIADAQAQVEQAVAGSKTALAQLRQAQADYHRFSTLYNRAVISGREFESYRTQLNTAAAAYEQALANVKSTKERLSLRLEGARQEQIDQARALVEVDKESLRQAKQQAEYTQLFAPFNAVVLSKSAEPGEYLNPGTPVVTIGQLDMVWLRAYVNETDLGRVKLGQQVEVGTDAYPGRKFIGRISFISSEAEFTPKSVQTFTERVKLMYRLKVELTNPDRRLKPGMPADAFIKAEK